MRLILAQGEDEIREIARWDISFSDFDHERDDLLVRSAFQPRHRPGSDERAGGERERGRWTTEGRRDMDQFLIRGGRGKNAPKREPGRKPKEKGEIIFHKPSYDPLRQKNIHTHTYVPVLE